MTIKLISMSLIAAVCFSVTAVAVLSPAEAAGWRCSAKGMISGSYNGGSTARIRLKGFSSGGTYAVTKKGKTARGVTANGTRFTCRKK